MAEHRRASTVCAKALEETPPRTALWDARPAPPPPPAAPTTPRQHPDESEDDFRARLETVLELRDRLETDDRMDLACECAKRGVAFDGDGAFTHELTLPEDVADGSYEVRLAVAVVMLEALEHQIMVYLAAAVPTTYPAQMRPVKKARVRVTGRWLLPIVLVSVLSLFLL